MGVGYSVSYFLPRDVQTAKTGFRLHVIIIIIIMEKTQAGNERPLYPINRCRITNTYYTL